MTATQPKGYRSAIASAGHRRRTATLLRIHSERGPPNTTQSRQGNAYYTPPLATSRRRS